VPFWARFGSLMKKSKSDDKAKKQDERNLLSFRGSW